MKKILNKIAVIGAGLSNSVASFVAEKWADKKQKIADYPYVQLQRWRGQDIRLSFHAASYAKQQAEKKKKRATQHAKKIGLNPMTRAAICAVGAKKFIRASLRWPKISVTDLKKARLA